tara:strand:+ start:491 stop:730 length:240 start_codon:yes stop_codon:yes gene_type:complete
MSNNELFKTIEAQGRLITELREENELLRKEFNEFKVLSERLVDYLEPHEEDHYEECVASDIDVSEHIMNVIKEVKTIIK